MKENKWISLLFYVGAAYDGLFGLIFLLFPKALFEYFNVTPPNHYGYVQFPAALLLIFGLMFLAIAVKPLKNYNLILYGILLKIAYCSLVFWYWFTTNIPGFWKPFAMIDVLFGVLFYLSYKRLSNIPRT